MNTMYPWTLTNIFFYISKTRNAWKYRLKLFVKYKNNTLSAQSVMFAICILNTPGQLCGFLFLLFSFILLLELKFVTFITRIYGLVKFRIHKQLTLVHSTNVITFFKFSLSLFAYLEWKSNCLNSIFLALVLWWWWPPNVRSLNIISNKPCLEPTTIDQIGLSNP